jgi:hypothetical protein
MLLLICECKGSDIYLFRQMFLDVFYHKPSFFILKHMVYGTHSERRERPSLHLIESGGVSMWLLRTAAHVGVSIPALHDKAKCQSSNRGNALQMSS